MALLIATWAGIALFGPIDRGLFAGGALLLFASLGLVRGVLVAWLFLAVIHASSFIHAVLVDGLAIAVVVNAALLTLSGRADPAPHTP